MKVMHMSGLLSAGPLCDLGGGFLTIPTVGISYMDFSEPDPEKEGSRTEHSLGFAAWAIGASFRIPLGGAEGASFITVNAGYRKAMTGIELAQGGYSFLTVGFGMFDRSLMRDF